jgi:hypothetical protein
MLEINGGIVINDSNSTLGIIIRNVYIILIYLFSVFNPVPMNLMSVIIIISIKITPIGMKTTGIPDKSKNINENK